MITDASMHDLLPVVSFSLTDLSRRDHHLNRLSCARLQNLATSEWQLEDEIILIKRHAVRRWIRQFDTKIGAIVRRMTNMWVKAAELVRNSDSDGVESLHLVFREDADLSRVSSAKS